jgi:hypothetical protein
MTTATAIILAILMAVALEFVFHVISMIVSVSPGVPVNLRVVQLGRDSMTNVLTYSLSVAAPVDADVVSRTLTVTVGDVAQDPVMFSGSATDLGNIDVPEGATVVLSLVDTDDAGNESVPAVVDFVAADTLAPGQPGAFTVSLIGERSEPDNG